MTNEVWLNSDVEKSEIMIEDEFLTEEDRILRKVRKKQVAILRNKVYIFFLALWLFMAWPTFLQPIEKVRWEWAFKLFSLNPIEGMHRNRWEWWLLQNIEDKNIEIEEKEIEIQKTEIEKEVVKHLVDEKKQNKIINCLNFDICWNMSDELKDELDFLRIFLMVWRLNDEKMDFDQKKILRNLSEYMLTSPQWNVYWDVVKINFWWVAEVSSEYKLQNLPIGMNIEFENKEWLFEFLGNMENKIYLDSVMYVIDSMNYDVVNYDEPQIVWIKANAYFFTWEIEQITDDLTSE